MVTKPASSSPHTSIRLQDSMRRATTMENFTSKTSKLHVIIDAAQSLVDQKQTQWDNDQANKELAADSRAVSTSSWPTTMHLLSM